MSGGPGRWRPYGRFRRSLAVGKRSDLGRWLGRGFWAITDQGLFTASNFVLNVLLARWLAPQDYGAFAVAYAVFALVGVFHTALLIEPMLVFGSDKYDKRLPGYLFTLLYGHLAFGALSSLLLLLGGLWFGLSGSRELSLALLALAAAAPFILFQWLMRRACYVRLGPGLAVWGGTLYTALLLAGMYVLYRGDWLTAPAAFGLMGIASLAAGLLIAWRLRVGLPESSMVRETAKDHWDYGRWSAPTRAMVWVTESSYFLFLPIFGGLEATAAVRALMNLILPIVQAYSALSTLLLPSLVRSRGTAAFGRASWRALALFVSASVAYWLVLGLLHRPLMYWLYGGQYVEYAQLAWFLGLLPLLVGVAEVLSTVLRALGHVERVFWAEALSMGTALTVGLGALYAFGVGGAVVWLLSSWAVTTVAMGWFLLSSRTQETT